jgi:uncharacterized radical SAM superfamily protein
MEVIKMKNIEFVKLTHTKSISTTKNYCFLNCKHCNKHYLKNMKSVDEIEELAKEGIKSFLISGGMNSNIEVPIIPFYEKLKYLKNKYNLRYNIHTGIVENSYEYLSKLRDLHDSISFDIVGKEEAYKNVYGNNFYKEMISSFDTLISENFNVKPHITLGLNGGKIEHEFNSLNILKKNANKIKNVIFIVFIPTKDTFFENKKPPNLKEIEDIFKTFKKEMPNTNLTLGCMQPKGFYRKELQVMSLKYLDKITQPLQHTIKLAEENNYKIEYSFECCAL